MSKLVTLMHISLDGLIGGSNGELDWVKLGDKLFDEVNKFTDESDTALYGRKTYEIMEAYWPTAADKPNASKHDKIHSAWYKRVNKIVLSKTMKDAKLPNTTIISDSVSAQLTKLKQETKRNILLLGSPGIIPLLMQEGLIDEYVFYLNPIVLGTGMPLFKGITRRIPLKLLSSKAFDTGVIALHYEKI